MAHVLNFGIGVVGAGAGSLCDFCALWHVFVSVCVFVYVCTCVCLDLCTRHKLDFHLEELWTDTHSQTYRSTAQHKGYFCAHIFCVQTARVLCRYVQSLDGCSAVTCGDLGPGLKYVGVNLIGLMSAGWAFTLRYAGQSVWLRLWSRRKTMQNLRHALRALSVEKGTEKTLTRRFVLAIECGAQYCTGSSRSSSNSKFWRGPEIVHVRRRSQMWALSTSSSNSYWVIALLCCTTWALGACGQARHSYMFLLACVCVCRCAGRNVSRPAPAWNWSHFRGGMEHEVCTQNIYTILLVCTQYVCAILQQRAAIRRNNKNQNTL